MKLEQKLHDFSRQFVRVLGAALLRQQPAQTVRLKIGLSLINGGSRKPELGRCLRHGNVLSLDGAEHFVFELQQIVRIEEERIGKEGMTDVLGMGVERAGLAKGLDLLSGRLWHEYVNRIMPLIPRDGKPISEHCL